MVPGVLETPPVPVTELLDSLLGLFRVGGHWRGGRGGSGSLGPRRPFQVHGVPENDGSDHQIQPAGSVALIRSRNSPGDYVLNGEGDQFFPLQSQCCGSIRSRSGLYDPMALSNARGQLRCELLGQRDRPLFRSLAKSASRTQRSRVVGFGNNTTRTWQR